jgi:4a-hydroxytetrahydrobiopterin dehydratase
MLSEKDVKKYLADLGSGWELKDEKVVKSFQLSSFVDAIDFVNKVAKIAESINHPPIITINWKTVKLSLKSFDVDAITIRDIDLATRIEELGAKLLQNGAFLIYLLSYNTTFKLTTPFRRTVKFFYHFIPIYLVD